MTTVTAEELFRDVALIVGWDPDNLSEREWKDIRDAVTHALKHAWEYAFWPDLMRKYHTAFKPSWSAAYIAAQGTYPVDTVLYDPFTGGYYQALVATATRPTDWNGTTKEWEYTPGVWHPTPNTVAEVTWDPEDTYVVGDVVSFDDETYVAMDSVAAGPANSPALDAASWHKLLPFSYSYDHTGWIGREPVGLVKSITDDDPDDFRGQDGLRFDVRQDSTVAFDPGVSKVWVKYRINCPKLTGDVYDATMAYEVAPADQQIYGEVIMPGTFAVYWGASTLETLNESGILALDNTAQAASPAGSYLFAAPGTPEKYMYLAWPDEFNAQPRAADGFMTGGMPMTGDMAGASQGYDQTENGWPYMLVTVGGMAHRVYRTLYPQALEITIVVND